MLVRQRFGCILLRHGFDEYKIIITIVLDHELPDLASTAHTYYICVVNVFYRTIILELTVILTTHTERLSMYCPDTGCLN